jgi:nitrogen fixation NifU-like protein
MFDELRELYQEVILDHGKHPRNYRELPDANHQARGDNPVCGDRIIVFLKVDGDNRIADVSFQGRGCAISQASASMMTEILVGKTVEEAETLFKHFHEMVMNADFDAAAAGADQDALDRLQVLSGVREFPMRVKCATLAWHTMHAALEGEDIASTE